MIFSDSWTEGLTKRQQNTVVDFVLNECQIKPGIGGYKNISAAKKFLNSPAGRKAVRMFAEFFMDTRKDFIKAKLIELFYIRGFYNPADIIDATGSFVIETEDDLHKLGKLAYCIEGIESEVTGMNPITGKPVRKIKIKLCDRNKSLEFLARLFDVFEKEKPPEELLGEKSVFEMSDEEREAEIATLLKKDPNFARQLLPENIEVEIKDE
jgi:hypothetical protein